MVGYECDKIKTTQEDKMYDNINKTLFYKYIDNQPEKLANRKASFCHIGNINCNNKLKGAI